VTISDTEKLTVLRWDAKVPLIDMTAVEYILGSLESMEVSLDPDPISLGPTRLQKKIAKARNLLTRVEKWFQIVHRADHDISRALLMARSIFSLKETDLIANDPEVKRAKAQKSREAIAHYKLKDDLLECFALEQAANDTDAVLRALNTKRTDLKDVVSRLRDQIQLCTAELGLNRKWGSDLEEHLSNKVEELRLEAHPDLSDVIEKDADIILDDILGDDSDCNVPSRRVLETRALRMNKEGPVQDVHKSTGTQVPQTPLVEYSQDATIDAMLNAASAVEVQSISETPNVKSDLITLTPFQPSVVLHTELVLESAQSASEFQDSSAEVFDNVSMDELQDMLQEAKGILPEVKTEGASLDGLPEDFWG
jgi:hypothetical protein